jgi:glycerophosphoryl diester phosphodiesterase
MNFRNILGVSAWYGVSYFFLQNPQYLHVKKQKLELVNKPKYILAHRGGSLEAPENTLQSFIHAHNAGADVIETDVRITKDGKILVCHDADFKRLCKNGKKVIDTLSTELPLF